MPVVGFHQTPAWGATSQPAALDDGGLDLPTRAEGPVEIDPGESHSDRQAQTGEQTLEA